MDKHYMQQTLAIILDPEIAFDFQRLHLQFLNSLQAAASCMSSATVDIANACSWLTRA